MVSKSTHISYNTKNCSICVPYEPIFTILGFACFVKNSKIEYDPHFWGGENILKIVESGSFRYPLGRNFSDEIALSHKKITIYAIQYCRVYFVLLN